jgi:uncharacterized protein YraI
LLSLTAVEPLFASEFPYTAEVTADDVYIRSGPGTNYYPTAKLQKGDQVEVYRQDPGGWCAIRPPRNSFSWVAAQKLAPVDGGLAAATEDRVVVRVGSSLSDIREVIQVRLDRRERVEVLAAPDSDDRSGGGWYKIAPPAGEFRWISVKFLQRVKHAGGNFAASDNRRDQHDHGDEPQARRRARPIGGDAESGGNSAASLAPQRAGDRPAKSAPYSLDRELNRLDLQLSAMVAEDISAWSFDDLKHQADAVLDDAESATERGRARLLLNKLARFEDIKFRYDQMHRAQRATDRQNQLLAGGTERRAADPRFDGSGRLSPVASSRAGAPAYALVDANGAVTHFITPAPGVNLRPFVNKQIGVNGPRSYMTDTQKQLISVQHVALIEQNRTY